jgi:ATP-dependent RNA helicase DeaD
MNNFSQFSLPDSIFRALEEMKFIEPTPIQSKVLPLLLNSEKDIIALAQTGTGKTAAFTLPILSKINEKDSSVQTIVLSPTRELAMQTADFINYFTKYIKGLKVTAVYGGSFIGDQIRSLKKGSQIVVGTPGRVLDLIKRNSLKLKTVKWVILDEADEMLNMGFVEDISSILSNTPKTKQSLLFSATMPKQVELIARKYMQNPVRVEVETTALSKMAISHQYMVVPAREKISAFQRYRSLHPDMYALVFCRTKRETQELGDYLLRTGLKTAVLNGDIEQAQRTRIMESFKSKKIKILVATDVAARGIDVEKLTHVVHFGVPDQVENYVHRSGRTGRAKEKGVSLVIANLREHRAIKKIERMCKLRFEEVFPPKRQDLIHNEVKKYIKTINSDYNSSNLAKSYLTEILKGLSSSDIKKIAEKSLLIGLEERIKKYPEENLDIVKEKKKKNNDYQGDMDTLVISLGRKDNLTVPNLLGLINDSVRGSRVDIGKIQIADTKASFEVPIDLKEKLCRDMSKKRFRNQMFHVKAGEEVKRSVSPRRKKNRGKFRQK